MTNISLNISSSSDSTLIFNQLILFSFPNSLYQFESSNRHVTEFLRGLMRYFQSRSREFALWGDERKAGKKQKIKKNRAILKKIFDFSQSNVFFLHFFILFFTILRSVTSHRFESRGTNISVSRVEHEQSRCSAYDFAL